jgi:hypothetical protein
LHASSKENIPTSRLLVISPHQQPPLQEEEEEVQAKQKKHVDFIQIPILFARKQQRKHTNFETSCNFSTPTTSMTRTKEEAKKPRPVDKQSRKAGDGN